MVFLVDQHPRFRDAGGPAGLACLRSFLRPTGRAPLADVAKEAWHQHILAVAIPRSAGIWGEYVVLKGEIPPEIQEWWCGSQLFCAVGQAKAYELGQSFAAPISASSAKFQQRQEGRKAVVNGCTVPGEGGDLFKKDASRFLFDDRAAAISEAFKWRNSADLYALQSSIRTGLKTLSRSELGENGLEFLKNDIMNWLFLLAQDHVFDGDPTLQAFDEQKHKDGGASVLHGPMTNNLIRDLHLFNATDSNKCDATLSSSQGTF